MGWCCWRRDFPYSESVLFGHFFLEKKGARSNVLEPSRRISIPCSPQAVSLLSHVMKTPLGLSRRVIPFHTGGHDSSLLWNSGYRYHRQSRTGPFVSLKPEMQMPRLPSNQDSLVSKPGTRRSTHLVFLFAFGSHRESSSVRHEREKQGIVLGRFQHSAAVRLYATGAGAGRQLAQGPQMNSLQFPAQKIGLRTDALLTR